MPGPSISSIYNREHRRGDGVIVCFISEGYCSFIKGDAAIVAPILQEPVTRSAEGDEVRLHMGRFPAARDQLVHSGKKLIVLKRTGANRGQWHRLGLGDIYDFSRFIDAHNIAYTDALAELKSGAKCAHWISYVFPQIAGLNFDEKSLRYALKDLGEAKGFFDHKLLGAHYRECCQALLSFADRNIVDIFDPVDALKVRASMTLFLRTGFHDAKDLCRKVLDAFFDGEEDPATLSRLGV